MKYKFCIYLAIYLVELIILMYNRVSVDIAPSNSQLEVRCVPESNQGNDVVNPVHGNFIRNHFVHGFGRSGYTMPGSAEHWL